jgi:hypothetical protein
MSTLACLEIQDVKCTTSRMHVPKNFTDSSEKLEQPKNIKSKNQQSQQNEELLQQQIEEEKPTIDYQNTPPKFQVFPHFF